MNVVWSSRARRDLDEIGHYIAQDNPVAAEKVAHRLMDFASRLESFPDLGVLRTGGFREAVEPRYGFVLRYDVFGTDRDGDPTRVEILSLHHPKRRR